MRKYIDADWLKDNLYRRCTNETKRNGYPEEYGLIDFIEMLNYSPAADVVEVVRCRDCKYYIEREDGYICANDYLYKDGDWFCSDGEKEDGA